MRAPKRMFLLSIAPTHDDLSILRFEWMLSLHFQQFCLEHGHPLCQPLNDEEAFVSITVQSTRGKNKIVDFLK